MAARLVIALIALGALTTGCGAAAAPPPRPAPNPSRDVAVAAPPPPADRQRCLSSSTPPAVPPPSAPAEPGAPQVAAIAQDMAVIRGLAARPGGVGGGPGGVGGVVPEFVDQAEMGRRIVAQLDEDYPPGEAEKDRRIYAALGAVPADIDLRATFSALLAGGVVGYYNAETKALVVVTPEPGAALPPDAQVTLAHELTHALADAAFGLPSDVLEGPSDAALAALALVEGDAELASGRYAWSRLSPQRGDARAAPAAGATPRGLLERAGGTGAQSQPVPLPVPYVLQAELLFPYVEGAAFVCGLFLQGGWPAVDAAYRDLPTTSAQILFPERYAAREGAVDPRDVGMLPPPWRLEQQDTFGAVELLWLFEAPGDDLAAAIDEPMAAASQWAGGEIQLWRSGGASAVGLALADRGGGRLCDALADWYEVAFSEDRPLNLGVGEILANAGPVQSAVVRCGGGEVRLGIGPDIATARALAR